MAGVSLNAIVGDNGIINNTLSASFIQEMTAVQEAFDTWKMSKKVDNLEDVSIPASNLVEEHVLKDNSRLMGEVGYYRTWAITETKPSIDVKSSDDIFKSAFSSEIIFYPAGVQDLYYIDNKKIGLEDNDKKYLIDAQNSMIYSLNGGTINGIRVHSLAMFRMIQSGISDAPQFAEAEVNGENGGKYAGSKTDPNGFEIIADSTNDNIYKLYNNGDLYAKGIKGPLLNTSREEMEKINQYKWSKLTIPDEIPGYESNDVDIVMGYSTIYVIDKNRDVWAWGDNTSNKLGLSAEEQKEYTGMEPIKLNFNKKKVYKVFPARNQTFIITLENGVYELFAAGENYNGELGIGEINSPDSFKKVEFNNPENIVKIFNASVRHGDLIMSSENDKVKLYFSGSADISTGFSKTEYKGNNITRFIEVANNIIGENLPVDKLNDIEQFNQDLLDFIVLGENGDLYRYNDLKQEKMNFGNANGKCVDMKVSPYKGIIVKRKLDNGEIQFWGYYQGNVSETLFSLGQNENEWFLLNDFFPENVNGKDIVDYGFSYGRSILFVTNSGIVFGSGYNDGLGINVGSGSSNGFVNIEFQDNLKISRNI